MTLIKTSVLSFIATAVKLLAGLVINKAVAVHIGPAGLALIGQFQNFTQIAMTFAQGAINTGVVKYTAEYVNDEPRRITLFGTASKISLCSSIIVGLAIIIFSPYASERLFKSEEYDYIFLVFGFTIVLFVINGLLLSILNGLKEIKSYITINIIQSLYSLLFTTIMIVWLGLDGALIALVSNQSVILLVTLWMLRKHELIRFNNFTSGFDKTEAKNLMSFSAMAIVTVITVPVSHLIVRDYIGEEIGWAEAGYWQAIWYISIMYLMVVTTAITVYFIPRLSELTEKKALRNELWLGYKLILPLVMFLGLSIFLLKDFIISILFTDEFTAMRELFFWQLLGDVFKISATMLGLLIAAKAKTLRVISANAIFSLSFVLISIYFLDEFGLIGVTIAHFVNYSIFLVYMYFVTKDLLYDK